MISEVKISQATMLALDGMIATSIALPMEMLSAAASMYRTQNYPNRRYSLSLEVAGITEAAVKSAGSLRLLPDKSFTDVKSTDLIIVPALWRNPKTIMAGTEQLLPWLQDRHKSGSIICAAGTGAFILAAAQLLNHKPATTHWFYLGQFETTFPEVVVKRHHLITQSGNIYCAGSVNSVASLMIHLIGELYNQEVAKKVEHQFSPEMRRPSDEIFYSFEKNNPHQDELIIDIQQWLLVHFNEKINMDHLARHFSVSQRTLNRRFKAATGLTPGEYLFLSRIEIARSLLKDSNLTIAEISHASGFQDASYFSKIFQTHFKISPKRYRNSVRAKLFVV